MISEEASNLIALYGSSCWHQQVEEKRADRAKLEAYIAAIEAENGELRVYRDGYRPKEKLPESGRLLLVDLEDIEELQFAFYRDSNWYVQTSVGWAAIARKSTILRWYPVPGMDDD